MRKNKSKKNRLYIILAIAFYFYSKHKKKKNNEIVEPSPIQNDKLGLQLDIPNTISNALLFDDKDIQPELFINNKPSSSLDKTIIPNVSDIFVPDAELYERKNDDVYQPISIAVKRENKIQQKSSIKIPIDPNKYIKPSIKGISKSQIKELKTPQQSIQIPFYPNRRPIKIKPRNYGRDSF